jgi:hypothetical protein
MFFFHRTFIARQIGGDDKSTEGEAHDQEKFRLHQGAALGKIPGELHVA